MIEVYKILTEKYDKDVNLYLERNIGPTRGNNLKLAKGRCRTKRRQMYFTARIVNVWNSLPNYVIEARSVISFEKRLDNYWKDQAVKYNFEENLITTPGHHISLSLDNTEDLDIEA